MMTIVLAIGVDVPLCHWHMRYKAFTFTLLIDILILNSNNGQ